ncbi:hypothetical protein Bbelb_309020 [Branchiostoma belcheri]|nr:hypothetical protein Bbelb_309020 [Branchiostoma belcheri]
MEFESESTCCGPLSNLKTSRRMTSCCVRAARQICRAGIFIEPRHLLWNSHCIIISKTKRREETGQVADETRSLISTLCLKGCIHRDRSSNSWNSSPESEQSSSSQAQDLAITTLTSIIHKAICGLSLANKTLMPSPPLHSNSFRLEGPFRQAEKMGLNGRGPLWDESVSNGFLLLFQR